MVPLVPENNIFGEPRPATVPSWFLATSNIATTKCHGADWYTTNVTRFRWLFSSKEKTGTFWNRRWWCEKRHKPNNHSNRLKCQVEMNEIPWTNNPVQKSPRKVFTFRVGLLTSFKLYKEPGRTVSVRIFCDWSNLTMLIIECPPQAKKIDGFSSKNMISSNRNCLRMSKNR